MPPMSQENHRGSKMLRVITAGETQYIIDTLKECARACDDCEEAVEECVELLECLIQINEEDYDELTA